MKIFNGEKRQIYIVLPENSSPCLKYAAQELTFFIKKCLNVSLKTVTDGKDFTGAFFSLGNTRILKESGYSPDLSVLNSDGFYIKTTGDNCYILAETDRGILFGVYEIAERFLGVRFICAETTVFPNMEKLHIEDREICEKPVFRLRGYIEYDLYEDDNNMVNQADKVFALRMRARHSFLFPSDKFGGGSKIWGRHNTHNFHYYVDEKIYNNPSDKSNYHPEFFFCSSADENAHFQFTVAGDSDTTICLTNGITDDGKLDESMDISVAKIVIEEMKKDIISHPDIDYFVFDQEDGNLCCQCERCPKASEKYKRSGILIRFVNVVAGELQKWADRELNGRKINLVTFAYAYTLDAPVICEAGNLHPIDKTIIPIENVIIRIAVLSDGFYNYFSEKQLDRTKNALKQWSILGCRFFVWTYDVFFDRYLLYMPSNHTIGDNVRGFKKFGCEYLMIEGAPNANNIWQCKLRAYLYHKAMWNENADIEKLTDEFLTHYFGETALPYMRSFIREYYDFYAELEKNKVVCLTFGMKNKEDFDKEFLLKTRNIIIDAKKMNAKMVTDKYLCELYDKRLSQVEVNSLFPLVEHYSYFFPDKTKEDYIEYAKEFLSLCRYAGITRYAETLKLSDWEKANFVFPY